jgi:hypothetical protein
VTPFKTCPMSDTPHVQNFRDKAERLREKASHIRDSEIRSDLQQIARQYELLAENLEQRAKYNLRVRWAFFIERYWPSLSVTWILGMVPGRFSQSYGSI